MGFNLGHACDLEFSRSNVESALSQPKMVWLSQNKKQTCRLKSSFKCDHRIWTWPWPWLNFQDQIWNVLYPSQRWLDCHKMKRAHIEWSEGFSDHQVWPWPWPWNVGCKDLPDSDRETSDVGVPPTSHVWLQIVGLPLNGARTSPVAKLSYRCDKILVADFKRLGL